jgi:hypothetical protein
VTAEIEVWGASTSQELPPLKSIPRLKPRTASDPNPMTITTAEIVNHVFRRPTKSIVVRPW